MFPEIQSSLTHPPLLVFLSCNDNHFSFSKGQLIIVVCLAIVDGLHPLDFALPLPQTNKFYQQHVNSTPKVTSTGHLKFTSQLSSTIQLQKSTQQVTISQVKIPTQQVNSTSQFNSRSLLNKSTYLTKSISQLTPTSQLK